MVQDCRVDTSIWLMLNRNSTAMASRRFGMRGIRISRTFEGRCVKTIVRISPNRDASR
jgi:hypothetical protein